MPCVTVQQKQEFPNVKGLHSDTESSESFPLHGRIFLLVTSGRQQSQTGLNDRKLRKKKKREKKRKKKLERAKTTMTKKSKRRKEDRTKLVLIKVTSCHAYLA